MGTEEPLAVPFRDPVAHPFQMKTNLRVVAPSLTSQAAAQAANQALIRSDAARGGGPRAAGTRRVSRRVSRAPAPPSSLQCVSYPLKPCSTPLLPEQDPRLRAEAPEPRPGRRMFGTSVSQGAQGAARAALGGYSQAYGTVCLSALGRLPLLSGPRA